jgi:hypothetical protein
MGTTSDQLQTATYQSSPLQVGSIYFPNMQTATIPNVYFNGFNLALTNSDSNLVLLLDGQPQVKLSMSFTTAKTLTAYLNDMMQKLESVTNHNIMKADEVEAGLRKLQTDADKAEKKA